MLFLLITQSTVFGMKDLEFRQRVNDISNNCYWMAPRWSETHQINREITRQLASELLFDAPHLSPQPAQEQKSGIGGELESPSTTKPIRGDESSFETSRTLEKLEQQGLSCSSAHSTIQSPDTISGFIHRDGWVFPFGTTPDMSNDSEIELIKKYTDRHDVAFLTSKFAFLQDELQSNTSVIDKKNRYKLSRRLSLIAKQFGQDPIMHYLLQTYSATRLQGACLSLDLLQQFLNRTGSITMNGSQVVLDSKNVAKIMRTAGQIIEHRRDYQAEKKRYPAATAGGQLLDQGPILSRISGILYKGTHSVDQRTRTDLVSTTPTQITNISPEVDAKVTHELLQRITASPVTDFEAYMKQVDNVFQDMKQRSELTPQQQRHLLALLMKRIIAESDPKKQFYKRKDLYAGTLKSLFEIYFGAWYMSDEQMGTSLDRACHTIDVISKFDLSQVTAEQLMDVMGTIIADVPYDIATLSALSWVQEVGALAKAENALQQMPNHLQKAYKFVLAEHPELIARTAEGVPIKLSGAELTSLLKNTADKMPGTAKKVAKAAKHSTQVAEVSKGFASIDELIESAGKLTRLRKGGTRQGFIKGNPETIFRNLAMKHGVEITADATGVPFFKFEESLVHLTNSKTGIPTLRININGKLYKIRIE